MDGKFDLIIKCAKESQEILIKSNQRKMQQDTIHEPMLFDSVMREQDQSTVTLKLSPEQFEQLKKHHQLLTTILTTTNQ
jgi:predicted DNA-binding protein (MmcQ/YjbR family)